MPRAHFLNLSSSAGGVPRHQELRQRGLLFQRQVSLDDVFTHRLASTTVVFSHRWFDPSHPDPENVKLTKAQAYVNSHPAVESVWMDWLCMPQKQGGPPRTGEEEEYFSATLHNVNMLYLGLQVCV